MIRQGNRCWEVGTRGKKLRKSEKFWFYLAHKEVPPGGERITGQEFTGLIS